MHKRCHTHCRHTLLTSCCLQHHRQLLSTWPDAQSLCACAGLFLRRSCSMFSSPLGPALSRHLQVLTCLSRSVLRSTLSCWQMPALHGATTCSNAGVQDGSRSYAQRLSLLRVNLLTVLAQLLQPLLLLQQRSRPRRRCTTTSLCCRQQLLVSSCMQHSSSPRMQTASLGYALLPQTSSNSSSGSRPAQQPTATSQDWGTAASLPVSNRGLMPAA
jgi:hypothetical protein